MHKTTAKLILLGCDNFEYINDFNSYFIYNKLYASSIKIREFIDNNYLKIHNYNTIVFYMNLLNFGGYCDWRVKTDNSLISIRKFTNTKNNNTKISDIIELNYSFKKLQWITFYRYIYDNK